MILYSRYEWIECANHRNKSNYVSETYEMLEFKRQLKTSIEWDGCQLNAIQCESSK